MTAANVSLRLLPSLKAAAERIAEQEGTSLDQLINMALAEKVAALTTAEFLTQRASAGDAEIFDRLLRQAPDVPPEDWDRLDP